MSKSLSNNSISVCIFTYNRANLITETIESIVYQLNDNDELIICDDGSTDKTKMIVEPYLSNNVKYFYKNHSGAPDTRNLCIKKSKGNFIMWVGSDDLIDKNIIKKYKDAINHYPQVDIFYCNQILFDSTFRIIGNYVNYDWYHKEEQMLPYLFKKNPLPDTGTLVRRDLYKIVGMYNSEFLRAQDFEFWSRVILYKKFMVKHINENLYYMRIHDKSLTGFNNKIKVNYRYELSILDNILKNSKLEDIFYSIKNNSEIFNLIINRFIGLYGFRQANKYLETYSKISPNDEVLINLKEKINTLINRYQILYKIFEELSQNSHIPDILDYYNFLKRLDIYQNREEPLVININLQLEKYSKLFIEEGDFSNAVYLLKTLYYISDYKNINIAYLLTTTYFNLHKYDYAADIIRVTMIKHQNIPIEFKNLFVNINNYLPLLKKIDKSHILKLDKNKIDFFAWERHHFDHLIPIWNALPVNHRGCFYISTYLDSINSYEISPDNYNNFTIIDDPFDTVKAINKDYRLLVTASYYGTFVTEILRPMAWVDHGTGQTYIGQDFHISERKNFILDLLPSKRKQKILEERFPESKKEIIGCPKLDKYFTDGMKIKNDKPVIAISFHFDRKSIPEARSAFPHFKNIIPTLATDNRYKILGHGHPRIIDKLIPIYKNNNIEIVKNFNDVLKRADLYICDNSSTIFEFAAIGKPVVLLNAPWYRKNIEHGLRFWKYSNIGINCDDPSQIKNVIEVAINDNLEQQNLRKIANKVTYTYSDGKSAKRAALALTKFLKNKSFLQFKVKRSDSTKELIKHKHIHNYFEIAMRHLENKNYQDSLKSLNYILNNIDNSHQDSLNMISYIKSKHLIDNFPKLDNNLKYNFYYQIFTKKSNYYENLDFFNKDKYFLSLINEFLLNKKYDKQEINKLLDNINNKINNINTEISIKEIEIYYFNIICYSFILNNREVALKLSYDIFSNNLNFYSINCLLRYILTSKPTVYSNEINLGKASIIIPLYNQGKYLETCINSIINQTYKNWEIIIVNDGSTDNSYQVALNLQKKYSHYSIKILSHFNHGKGYTRNRGVRESSGKYICVLDADDAIANTYLETSIIMLEKNKSIGWIIPKTIQWGPGISQIFYLHNFDFVNNLIYCMSPVSSIYRKKVWQDVGGYSEDMIDREDWEFWIKAGEIGWQGITTQNIEFIYLIINNRYGEKAQINYKSKEQLISKHPLWYKSLNITDKQKYFANSKAILPTEIINFNNIEKYYNR